MHAHLDGFDLHAAVAIQADDRPALECLCRYLARPAIAQDSLELLSDGNIRVELRNTWRDGTTHLLFEPLELIGRLAAFVPRPRINLVVYHGVHLQERAAVERVIEDTKGRQADYDEQQIVRLADVAGTLGAMGVRMVGMSHRHGCHLCDAAIALRTDGR